MLIKKYKKTFAFLLGAFSVLAMPPYFITPILFLTFGYWILEIIDAKTKKQAFVFGYWLGFGFYSIGLAWVGNALLIDVKQTGWLYPICFLASGAFFGLFFGLPALMSAYFKNVYNRYFAFVSSIVLFEWVRSWLFTGFPWNPVGSSLAAYNPLMQIASIGGVFFASLVLIYIVTLPALYKITKNKKVIYAMFALIAFVVCFGFYKTNNYKYEKSDVVVRMVQPAIPQTMKWNKEVLEVNFNEYIKMSAKDNANVDLVIWGETATPFALEYEPEYRKQIAKAVPKGGHLITGVLRYEFEQNGRYQPLNSMVVVDEKANIINYYDKSHLVPFGEYIPLRKYLPSFIKPVVNIIGEFKKGEGPKTIKLENLPFFGGSICYEIIFPNANVDRSNKPEFLINLTNDGWYGKSAGPYQHLVAAQFRALEEGLSVIRVANTGISALISPLGEVLASIGLDKKGALDVSLPKKSSVMTFYQIWQNYLILIIITLTLIIATIKEKRNGK